MNRAGAQGGDFGAPLDVLPGGVKIKARRWQERSARVAPSPFPAARSVCVGATGFFQPSGALGAVGNKMQEKSCHQRRLRAVWAGSLPLASLILTAPKGLAAHFAFRQVALGPLALLPQPGAFWGRNGSRKVNLEARCQGGVCLRVCRGAIQTAICLQNKMYHGALETRSLGTFKTRQDKNTRTGAVSPELAQMGPESFPSTLSVIGYRLHYRNK